MMVKHSQCANVYFVGQMYTCIFEEDKRVFAHLQGQNVHLLFLKAKSMMHIVMACWFFFYFISTNKITFLKKGNSVS